MAPKRRGGFFQQETRPEDEAARMHAVEALIAPRRTITQDLPVDRISPNPFQARQTFEALDELAEAIRTQGFVSRLRVRPHPLQPDRFQLVYGERRLRAAKLAGLDLIPCEIADHTDDELLEIGLAENIQRRDLHPLEEARAFQTFIDQRNYSIRRLAERIGKDKSYVEDRLALLRTPADVQQMIRERPDALRSAREIAKVESPGARESLIAGVVAGELSTADVRFRVREAVTSSTTQSLVTTPRTADVSQLAGHGQGGIEQEAQTILAILRRWHALQAQEPHARPLVTAQTEAILQELQHLISSLAD